MRGEVPERERLNRAAAGALALEQEISSADFARLRDQLLGYARSSVRLRSESDYSEIVDAAIVKFMEAAHAQRVRPATALAYLRSIVRNAALDEARRATKFAEAATNGALVSDDMIARYVDESADADLIETILRECVASGDRSATRVINAFLNLAEELQSTPSSRMVADRAQVSHTTVQNVLRRLRDLAASTHDALP